jgi:RNA-directed DNA polymerase
MNSLKWNSIEWPLVESRIFRYQTRIYRASKNGNTKVVRNRLLTSIDSRLLAVHRVTTENKKNKTLGLNSKLYLSPQEKMKLVKSLKLDGKAEPIKKVGIPKPGHTNQKQPLRIQRIEDRAKQALC